LSGHAAGAADVFDDDRLMKRGGQAVREDARDRVARASGGEGNHKSHRMRRPVAGLRASDVGSRAGHDDARDGRCARGNEFPWRSHRLLLRGFIAPHSNPEWITGVR
jgi:hypothetical protein